MEDFRRLVIENIFLRISYTAIMIAFVFIATVVFSLYIPATEGFFNIGEAGVYIAALTGGPLVGAVAGGIGSMFADLYLGYGIYAPATLVIKGIEGFIVGYLSIKFENIFKKGLNRALGLFIGSLAGIGIMSLGNLFYIGEAQVTIPLYAGQYVINITSYIWYILGIIVIASVLILGYKFPNRIGDITAMVIGGSEMITGYFLYEYLVLYKYFRMNVLAYAEIPYNTMQMIIGILIAVVVISVVKLFFREK